MSFWGALTGSDAKKYAQHASRANTKQLDAGYAKMADVYGDAYNTATNYLQPYAQRGQQAYTAYNNMLGLNGAGAQQGSMAAYQATNPYLMAEQDRMTRGLDRRAAATGQFGGGLNALAKARAIDESGYRNYTDYMNRLQGLGSAGMGAASGMGGLAMQNAGNRAGLEQWYRGGNMTNSTNMYNALAAANQSGFQNIMGLGGLGIAAAQVAMGMPPTAAMGKSTTPGTAANGGWTTTVSPAGNNFFGLF